MIIARIPAMADPMGAYWRQPKDLRMRVGIFHNHVTIDEADWLALPDYRTSDPSGVYPGKVWRCRRRLCWYGPARDGRCYLIRARTLITGPGTNVTYRPEKAK